MRNTLQDLEYGKKHRKSEKLEMHFLGPGIRIEIRKTWKMRNKHCLTWNMARNTQKRGKLEMNIVGPGLWRKN